MVIKNNLCRMSILRHTIKSKYRYIYNFVIYIFESICSRDYNIRNLHINGVLNIYRSSILLFLYRLTHLPFVCFSSLIFVNLLTKNYWYTTTTVMVAQLQTLNYINTLKSFIVVWKLNNTILYKV